MKVDVTPSKTGDCAELLARVSSEDRADMLRGWGMPMEEALLMSVEASEQDGRWTIRKDGAVIGMFGCTPEGNFWLMRAKDFDSIAIRFIRRSSAYIDAMAERHGEIHGFASNAHEKLLRWLRWAGFEIKDLKNGYFQCTKRSGVM